jgi:hypothetical protein
MEPTRQVGEGGGGHALGTGGGEVPVQDLGGGPSSSKLGRTQFLFWWFLFFFVRAIRHLASEEGRGWWP